MLQKHVCCHFTEEQQRLSVSVGSLPSVSLNSTSVHIFQTTTSESPVLMCLCHYSPKSVSAVSGYIFSICKNKCFEKFQFSHMHKCTKSSNILWVFLSVFFLIYSILKGDIFDTMEYPGKKYEQGRVYQNCKFHDPKGRGSCAGVSPYS